MHLWEARILDGLASRHQVTAPSSPQLTLVLETSGLLLHHHRRLCLAAEKLLRSMVSKLGENYAKPVTYNPKLKNKVKISQNSSALHHNFTRKTRVKSSSTSPNRPSLTQFDARSCAAQRKVTQKGHFFNFARPLKKGILHVSKLR